MPGAWEHPRPNTLIVTLTRELVTTAWAMSFKELLYPSNTHFIPLYGMPFDHARNVGCQRALDTQHEYLFFLDDDVLCPPDILYRLQARNLDIVSGIYCRRNEPTSMPVMMREIPGKGAQFITEFKMGELVEADLIGCGCMLIKRKVLEVMDPPWFVWKCDPWRNPGLTDNERCSEDYDFCRKAKALGFKLFVDTSIVCLHAGHGCSIPGEGYKPLKLP